MRKINIFKAKSRLGIIDNPLGHEPNYGVENGPGAFVNDQLLKQLNNSANVFEYNFSLPEDIDEKEYRSILYKELVDFSNLIKANTKDELQIIIGGDHGVAFSSLLNIVNSNSSEKVGVVMIDSHTDINTFETSPSGNFHGIWLRAFLTDINNTDFDTLTKNFKIDNNNLVYIGNLEPDTAELQYINENQIKTFYRDNILSDNSNFLTEVKALVNRCDHIHLSIDMDAFDKSIVTGTGMPKENGIYLEDIDEALNYISENSKNLSIDIVEINPDKIGGNETVKFAQDLLLTLIKDLK